MTLFRLIGWKREPNSTIGVVDGKKLSRIPRQLKLGNRTKYSAAKKEAAISNCGGGWIGKLGGIEIK